MNNKISVLMAVAVSLFCGCGNKAQQTVPVDDADSLDMVADADRTVFGACGDGSAMNTMQLITDNGDTLTLSVMEAKENRKLFGGYASGDRMAVIMNEDKTAAELVINESTLLGSWVRQNPSDGNSVVGISLKEGGIVKGIGQSSIIYKIWKITDGRLEIRFVRKGVSDVEETNIYDIRKLDGDSLVYGTEEELFKYQRQY